MTDRIRSTLDAMQARAEAATEGPWEVQRDDLTDDVDVVHDQEQRAWIANTGLLGSPYVMQDAEFIAAARQDLPALLGFARDVLALADEYAKPAAHRSHGGLVPVNRLRALAARHLGGGSDD